MCRYNVLNMVECVDINVINMMPRNCLTAKINPKKGFSGIVLKSWLSFENEFWASSRSVWYLLDQIVKVWNIKLV